MAPEIRVQAQSEAMTTPSARLMNYSSGSSPTIEDSYYHSGVDPAVLVREAKVIALRKACFTSTAAGLEGDGLGADTTEDTKVVATKDNFELAFANVRPSVSEDDREQYKELATRFGWGKTVRVK